MEKIPDKLDPDSLPNLAHSTGKEKVRHNYTEEEILIMKDQVFTIANEKGKKDAVLKSISEAFATMDDPTELWGEITDRVHDINHTSSMKSLNKKFPELIGKINDGYEIKEQNVYSVDYQEEGMMGIYSEDGILLYTRRLRPEERQTTIFSLNKAAQ